MNQKEFKTKLNQRFPEMNLKFKELGNNMEAISQNGKWLFQSSRYTNKIKMFMDGKDCGEVIFDL